MPTLKNKIANIIKQSIKLPAWLLLTLTALFWSGNFFFGAVLKDNLPPFMIALSRWILVTLLLTPFLYKHLRKEWPVIKANLLKIGMLSFFGVTINTSLFYLALHHATVINAGMISATLPIMTLCLSVVFKQDKVNFGKILAIFGSCAGVILIVLKGNFQGSLTTLFNFGDLLIFIACLGWALYSVLFKKFKLTLSPFVLLYVTSIIGAILLIPFTGPELSRMHSFPFANIKLMGGLLYMAVFASILAFTCWNQGVKKIGPAKAGVYFNLLALFSALWAILFLHESFGWYDIVGGVIIFVSILYINYKAKA